MTPGALVAQASLAESLLGPHRDTLRKLMHVRKCRTRKELLALNVDPAELLDFLDPPVPTQDLADARMRFTLRDVDVARTLGVTQRRWNYVKYLLLLRPAPSARAAASEERSRMAKRVSSVATLLEHATLSLA
mgnify:CR=1 FL=1